MKIHTRHTAKHHATALAAALLLSACGTDRVESYGPTPSDAQLAWHRMEMNMFCHFGPNTFSGAEWGSGQEGNDVFCPHHLDTRQWAEVAKSAGMQGIIVTAKHHDGFCLWPSTQSTHTVAQSTWRDGNGDVLRELREGCDAVGVKMGVYLSPWDRNDPTYGTPKYNSHFEASLREVHQNYGPLFEQWFDGANGEGPNGRKQQYDWPMFINTVLQLNPQCVIFSDVGPGCRWVGNEEGRAATTCWSRLNTEGATPSDNKPAPAELEVGHADGSHWVPAECDVSLRPGWFWHPDEHPKSVEELMEIYFTSVGRGGLLLLNVPPDTGGRIAAEDSLRLLEFRAQRDRLFAHDLAQGAQVVSHDGKRGLRHLTDTAYHTYWAAKHEHASLTVKLDSTTTFDIVMLQEYISLGQRVCNFSLHYQNAQGEWLPLPTTEPQTTIGYKRLLRLATPVRTTQLRIDLEGAAPPVLNRIALYNSNR